MMWEISYWCTARPVRSLAFVLAACCVRLCVLVPVAAGQDNSGGGGKAVSVDVVKPARRPMVRELRLPATLTADEQVDLFAKISGYVAEIKVDIGDQVHQDDVLVRIAVPEMADDLRRLEAVIRARRARVSALKAKASQALREVDTARAQVRRVQAQYELDTINLKRNRTLHEGEAIPQQSLDEARSAFAISEARLAIVRTQVAGAEAQVQSVDADVLVAEADVAVGQADLARLKTMLEYTTIRAPFDGVIVARGVDHGTFVRSAVEGTTLSLLRVAKTDRIRVVLDIPESDAPYVRVGTAVDITVKALKEKPFAATVSRTARALSPKTRTMRAEIDIDNREGRFAPGMYAGAVVKLETKAAAMMIPSKALRVQGGGTIVLVSDGGVARAISVKIGYDDGVWAEVLSGLTGEEAVITATGGSVSAGAVVSPVFSDS